MGKKRKLSKESYRSNLYADGASPSMPKKHYYRQRAHANVFADHNLQ
jgi:hypothetical protein